MTRHDTLRGIPPHCPLHSQRKSTEPHMHCIRLFISFSTQVFHPVMDTISQAFPVSTLPKRPSTLVQVITASCARNAETYIPHERTKTASSVRQFFPNQTPHTNRGPCFGRRPSFGKAHLTTSRGRAGETLAVKNSIKYCFRRETKRGCGRAKVRCKSQDSAAHRGVSWLRFARLIDDDDNGGKTRAVGW